jgi:hypothetical protein
MASNTFELPDEAVLAPLLGQFPGRDHQIRSLASLLHVRRIPLLITESNLLLTMIYKPDGRRALSKPCHTRLRSDGEIQRHDPAAGTISTR